MTIITLLGDGSELELASPFEPGADGESFLEAVLLVVGLMPVFKD